MAQNRKLGYRPGLIARVVNRPISTLFDAFRKRRFRYKANEDLRHMSVRLKKDIGLWDGRD